ncbi:hypothetical protein [Epilithonimonas sp. UC225_85]|uniref:hypothetical protein n=1 Tax=Epilithonimonas sp. UC225_85 TaxID=3350167 RepID=UPI0036D3FBB0
MRKYQETIYKFILYFSALINLFLIGLLFFVLRDSLSGKGDYFLEGRSFWYFIAVIAAYSIANFIFLIQLFKKTPETEPEKSIEE